ncbi:(2Fe-2S)-binding protein [Thalassospira profundimaris]|uniref:(2Fe-2S)-binding protein n=1 Tax=Thalassospira profundimaris TaxID=502049 RepID=A0A367X0C0_9PROT|nr:Rieske 2Fe-2S domain-containing protein [Thalassospira profundimaris]RCK46460.1 (2Fe-2S)-binding protein [Thalassospira profundimaris]
MLTQEQNDMLSRVGSGTPAGELLRRYWHPIAAKEDLQEKWTVPVRLMGEDLVLYRDRQGRLGLLARQCPHRRASLVNGIPTEDGLRCPYHGWAFGSDGQCLEQPNEPEGSSFCQKIKTTAYKVQELGGMIWAYMGPDPAPLLPLVDGFIEPGTVRMMGRTIIPVNWLQAMENSLDPVHTEWLHGHLYEFVKEQENVKVAISAPHAKIAFKEFEYGMTKHRLLVGQSEDSDDWKVGHPVMFPNTLSVGNGDENSRYYAFQIRVPVDDIHTLHIWYTAYVPPQGVDVPSHLTEKLHTYEVPIYDENGDHIVDNVDGQDMMAWISQGALTDRTQENLGSTDQGIAAFRRMLRREIKKVEAGEDPMCVFRDESKHGRIDLPNEKKKHHNSDGMKSWLMRTHMRFSPILDDLVELYEPSGKQPPARKAV